MEQIFNLPFLGKIQIANLPHNGEICGVITLKTMEFRPFDPEARVKRARRRLPHWFQGGGTYYVTFRLADSLPKAKRDGLEAELSNWLEANGVSSIEDLKRASEDLQKSYRTRFTERIEALLDAGLGSCVLRDPECSLIVEEALRHFDCHRYCLDEFTVMPNHVHCLVCPLESWTLSKILQSWKRYSARKINRLTGNTGTSLWLDENFDHLVRSEDQLERYRCYIRENPKKAGIPHGSFRLGCGNSGADF